MYVCEFFPVQTPKCDSTFHPRTYNVEGVSRRKSIFSVCLEFFSFRACARKNCAALQRCGVDNSAILRRSVCRTWLCGILLLRISFTRIHIPTPLHDIHGLNARIAYKSNSRHLIRSTTMNKLKSEKISNGNKGKG